MADRHKASPISFRPTEDDREWLLEYAKRTGKAVNALLREALALLRDKKEEHQ